MYTTAVEASNRTRTYQPHKFLHLSFHLTISKAGRTPVRRTIRTFSFGRLRLFRLALAFPLPATTLRMLPGVASIEEISPGGLLCSRKHLSARGREFLSLVELLLGDCELRFLLECDSCKPPH
jgi:hypothetical protein